MKKLKKAKYYASHLTRQVIVETDFLDLHRLVSQLNAMGLGLGTGHDGINFNVDTFILELTPYPGAMTQEVEFKLFGG